MKLKAQVVVKRRRRRLPPGEVEMGRGRAGQRLGAFGGIGCERFEQVRQVRADRDVRQVERARETDPLVVTPIQGERSRMAVRTRGLES